VLFYSTAFFKKRNQIFLTLFPTTSYRLPKLNLPLVPSELHPAVTQATKEWEKQKKKKIIQINPTKSTPPAFTQPKEKLEVFCICCDQTFISLLITLQFLY